MQSRKVYSDKAEIGVVITPKMNRKPKSTTTHGQEFPFMGYKERMWQLK